MKWRSLLHYCLLIPLWLVFFWGWHLILFRWPQQELLASLRLLAATGALCAVVVVLWIRHNIGIYKEKGPRLQARQVHSNFKKDVLGRDLVLPASTIAGASHIVVEVHERRKVYRPASMEEREPEGDLEPVGKGSLDGGMDSTH